MIALDENFHILDFRRYGFSGLVTQGRDCRRNEVAPFGVAVRSPESRRRGCVRIARRGNVRMDIGEVEDDICNLCRNVMTQSVADDADVRVGVRRVGNWRHVGVRCAGESASILLRACLRECARGNSGSGVGRDLLARHGGGCGKRTSVVSAEKCMVGPAF